LLTKILRSVYKVGNESSKFQAAQNYFRYVMYYMRIYYFACKHADLLALHVNMQI